MSPSTRAAIKAYSQAMFAYHSGIYSLSTIYPSPRSPPRSSTESQAGSGSPIRFLDLSAPCDTPLSPRPAVPQEFDPVMEAMLMGDDEVEDEDEEMVDENDYFGDDEEETAEEELQEDVGEEGKGEGEQGEDEGEGKEEKEE